MSFQKIILIIAIIILIITLVFIGYALHYSSLHEQWPPLIGDCPDYWVDMSGNGSQCVNNLHLGTCNIPTSSSMNAMNFTSSNFLGSNGDCAKYRWAKGCGVTWDGITSGVSNPCVKK